MPKTIRIEHAGEANPAATPTPQGYAISIIRKRLQSTILSGGTDVPTELRQNPANDCQLEYSIDGGDTWQLAFDYSLCLRSDGLDQKVRDYQLATTPQQINYAAPNETFASKSTDTTQAGVQRRYDALCYVVSETVDTMLDQWKAYRNTTLAWVNIAQVAIGVGAGVAAVLTGGAAIPITYGILLGIVGIGQTAYATITDAMVDNATTRQKMKRHMYRSLSTRAVSLTNFYSVFDTVLPCLSADEVAVQGLLASILKNDLSAQVLYAGFLDLLGNAVGAVDAGDIINDCEEGAETWSHWFNFKNIDLEGWNVVTGTPVDGEINWGYRNPPTNNLMTIYVTRSIWLPEGSTLTGIGMRMGGAQNNRYGSIVVNSTTIASWNNPGAGTFFGSTTGSGPFTGKCVIGMSNNYNGPLALDINWIDGIRLSGTGDNPFAICDVAEDTTD